MGSDMPIYQFVSVYQPGSSEPDIVLGDGYGQTEADAAGDVIVMSTECRDFPPVTFNEPCFNKTSVSFIPRGGWFAANWGQPVLDAWFRPRWEPGRVLFLADFPRRVFWFCIGIPHRNWTHSYSIARQISWTALIYRVIWAGMMYHRFVSTQDSLYRYLLQQRLFNSKVLDVRGVHLHVSGMDLLCRGDLVWYGSSLMMSDDTGYGDWFPLTTASRSRSGGSGCCGWLMCCFSTQIYFRCPV